MTKNAQTTIERFVSTHLSDIAVEPYVPPAASEAIVDTVDRSANAPLAERSSVRVLGRALIVFVCGVAVGYLLSTQADLSPVQAKAASRFGASGLRIDYDLRHY
jgi:hypothetical protein